MASNSDVRVADHANADEPAVVIVVGEASTRERLSTQPVAEGVTITTRRSRPFLSRRENQMLRFAIQGLTNDEIASRLRLAAATVKSQLRSAFAKLAGRSHSDDTTKVPRG